MIAFIAYFSYIAYNETFVGDISGPEIVAISLVVLKMIQMGFVVWASLDRFPPTPIFHAFVVFIISTIAEAAIILTWTYMFIHAAHNGTLANMEDCEFENQRKIMAIIYIVVFLPLKGIFAWNLRQLQNKAEI